ncbi:hypothetical protein, partial [Candidatus Chlorohelix sp.]|uniref:OmpL47-type beta-barrel domain-containing protein n=1 Tax=Candidatus Chlorohelix sp. TaxID=3139201 RepID=UPI003054951C
MLKYTITSEVVELAPGQSADVTLTLSNQSEIIDQFALYLQPLSTPEAAGLYPEWVVFNPTNFSLRPSQASHNPSEGEDQQTITIKLTLSEGITAGAYHGQIIIQARSGSDNSLLIPFRLVVSKVEKQIFELQLAERISRRRGEVYRVFLANQGNAPALYSLYAEDTEDACRYDLAPGEVYLDQNQEAHITLKVRPRERNWTKDPVRHDFVINLDGYTEKLQGNFTQKCALPPVLWLKRRWVMMVAAFVILFGLLIAGLFFLFSNFTPALAVACGPSSLRHVNLITNNGNTAIFVSGRAGIDPLTPVRTESASILPGIFEPLVSVSPDGRRLVYATARNLAMDDTNLWILDLDTRKPTLLVNIPSGFWPTAPVWSSDGETLVYVKRKKPVKSDTTVATTTSATTTTATTTTAGTTPSPSPDVGANDPLRLEMYFIGIKAGSKETFLSSPQNFDPALFYGNEQPVLCWTTNNSSILIRPKAGEQTVLKNQQVEISFPEGKVVQRPRPGFNLPTPKIPNLTPPKIGANIQSDTGLAANRFLPMFSNSLAQLPANQSNNSCPVINPFSMNDPRWADVPLRVGITSKVGDYGCAITAAAILLNQYLNQLGSTSIQPDALIDCLRDNTSPLTITGWAFIGQNCSDMRLQLRGRADFSWNELDSILQRGPAIVGMLGGPTGNHFLVVTSGSGGDARNYNVVDPWDGSTYKNLQNFLSFGYRPKWLLSYEGQGFFCGENTINQEPSPLSIESSGIQDGKMYRQDVNFKFAITGKTLTTTLTAIVKIRDPRTPPSDSSVVNLPEGQQIPFRQDGNYVISIQAKNPSNPPVEVNRNIFFTVDNTSPEIKARILTGADPKTNKYSGPVTLQLDATDALSGISSIEYQVDGSPWRSYTSDTTTNSITVKDKGEHVVNYRATDGAGNLSSVGAATFTIEPPINREAPAAAGIGGNQTTTGGNNSGGAVPTTKAPVTTAPINTTRAVTPIVATPTVKATPTVAQPITTALPTATPLPTATSLPIIIIPTSVVARTTGLLAIDNAQLTFGPGISSLNIKLSNTGSGSLNWTVSPGISASLLKFGNNSGALLSGTASILSVSLASTTLPFQAQSTSFQIVSDGGNKTVTVVINPQPLPTAVFSSPITGTVLGLDTPITLTINTNQSTATPNHAVLIATYVTAAGLPPADVTLTARPATSNSFSINWDTTTIIPQAAIKLRGKFCVSADESICTDIPEVTNLNIPLGGSISTPTDASILSSSAIISVTATGRANHAKLKIVFQDDLSEVVIPSPPASNNNWSVTWNTLSIRPERVFNLKGLICSSVDESVCVNMPDVLNLRTRMSATVTTSQNLTSNKVLPTTINVTIGSPTDNIEHVSLYATFGSGAPTLISNNIRGTSWQGSWNTTAISAQTGIILDVKACFDTSENICTPLASFPNLMVQAGPPSIIKIIAGSGQSAVTGSSFAQPFKIQVTDANKNPLPQVGVIFTAPDPLAGPSILFGTAFTSNTFSAVTDVGGFVTTSLFVANNNTGNGYTVNVSVSGTSLTANLLLNNLLPNSTPIQPNAGSGQSAIVQTNFGVPLQATVVDATNLPVQNITVTFMVQSNGAGAIFPSTASTSATAITDINGVAIAPALKATCTPGAFTVNAFASGPYVPATFSLTNLQGAPSSLQISAGNNISATVTTAFTPSFAVQVRDICNNNLDGQDITFTAPSSGASGTFANGTNTTTVKSANGGIAAATNFIANTTAGNNYQVSAVVASNTAISTTFTISNIPGQAATITPINGNGQNAKIFTAFPNQLSARVKDAQGNLLITGTVTFAAPSSGASGKFSTTNNNVATAIIDASGVVTAPVFTANGTASLGAYQVSATIGSATNVFSLTNLPGDPNSLVVLAVTGGSGQNAAVNTNYTSHLTATLKDVGGNTLDGYNITFTAPSSGSSIVFSSNTYTHSVTSAGGGVVDSGAITAGKIAASNFIVLASVDLFPSVTASYTLTNNPGNPAVITIMAGDNQSVKIGTVFTTSLAISITDTFNNPVPSTGVTFAAPSSGTSGTFASTNTYTATATTGVNGVATASAYTANTIAGNNYAVNIKVTSFPAVNTNFTLSNLKGDPNKLTITGGNEQSASVDNGFSNNLKATLTDIGNNTLDGYQVTFTASGVSANAIFTATTSNITVVSSSGGGLVDSGGFKANTTSGSYTVQAAVNGFSAVTATYNLNNLAGDPANIAISNGNSQSVKVKNVFGTNLEVTVTDSHSNPVSGTVIIFAAPQYNPPTVPSGKFSSSNSYTSTVTTNSSGVATASALTANKTAGAFSVTASLSGFPSVTPATFNLTNNTDNPAALIITNGDGQNAVVNNNFANSLIVRVEDSGQNTLNGYTVLFTSTVSTSPGVVFDSTASYTTSVISLAGGIADSGGLKANTTAGANYSVKATVQGFPAATVNFTLTNNPGTPNSIGADSGVALSQAITVNTAYAPLKVLVKDSYGNPVSSGYDVTFTAPSTGASGAFSSGNSITVQTNSSGVANPGTFTANTGAGAFTVSVAVSGATNLNFSMTNNPGVPNSIEADSGVALSQAITVNTAYA